MSNKDDLVRSTLTNQLELNETNAKLQSLVGAIRDSGAEGIQDVAYRDPDLIITTLSALAALLETTFKSNNQLLEYWLAGIDREAEHLAFLEDLARRTYGT